MEPIDLGFIFFRQSSYPVISRLSRTALIHLRQTSQTANHSTNIHFYFSRSAEYRPAKTANTWEKRTRSLGLTLPQQFRRFRSNTKRASYSLLSRNIPPCIYLCTCIFLRWMKKTYSILITYNPVYRILSSTSRIIRLHVLHTCFVTHKNFKSSTDVLSNPAVTL